MASLTIYDTGYLKTNHSGTQLSSSNRANSGSAIELKSVVFSPTVTAQIDDTPVVATNTETEINLGSIENIKFTLSGIINTADSAELALIYPFVQCIRTRGYKALFYNVSETATPDTLDRNKQLIYQLANGNVATTQTQSGISFRLWTGSSFESSKNLTHVVHLKVEFISFVPRQIAGSKMIAFTLTGVTTS